MENTTTEVNNEELTPAVPGNEATPDNPVTTTEQPTETVNLDALSEDERDSYLSIYQNMTDAEIAALPPDMRREYREIKAKLDTPAMQPAEPAETAPEETPETAEPAAEPETAQPDAETEKPSTKISAEEKIRILTEELRKANARYSTLQGKYNAEHKKSKISDTANATSDTPPDEAGTGNNDEKSGTDAEDQALADELGLDVDVAKAIRKSNERHNAELRAEINRLSNAQRDALLDSEVRNACGGLSLDEVGGHPLFSRYARRIKEVKSDGTYGISAAEAIAEAKESGDLRGMANIAAQVVNWMRSIGVWDLDGHLDVKPAEPVNVTTQDTTTKPQAAKPTAATPHVSGGVPNAGQTTRTVEVVEAELDAALARFRRDKSAAGDINRLTRELNTLEAKRQ